MIARITDAVTRRTGALSGALLVFFYLNLASCAVNPVTGDRELSLVSEEQEIRMGREADQAIQAQMGVYDDPELQRYVNEVGQRLAAGSERPNLPWTFRVIDDPTVNAFALPGGFIYLTRGILAHMNSEAEMASVLGHEIGHVTARHSVNQMSKAQLAQIGLVAGAIFVPGAQDYLGAAQAGLQLLFLKFGRDDEREADALGFRYMVREDYDPRPMAEMFQTLERVGESQGAQDIPQWLSTHPNPGDREETTQERIQAGSLDLQRMRVGRSAHMGRLDGVVFGVDPRQGYFRGDRFYHPELRFQLQFPDGWKKANRRQSVLGVAPDQDAITVLSLSEETSPQAAARAFYSQQGVDELGSTSGDVNGLSAVRSDFRVRTEEGTLQGAVLWVSYDGNIYQLLGYAPSQRWGRYQRVVQASLGSFAPLTDPDALRVEPQRVRIVNLGSPISLDRFVQQYASTVTAEVVALLNHVPFGGTVPAGQVKRVVGEGVPGSGTASDSR